MTGSGIGTQEFLPVLQWSVVLQSPVAKFSYWRGRRSLALTELKLDRAKGKRQRGVTNSAKPPATQVTFFFKTQYGLSYQFIDLPVSFKDQWYHDTG